MDCVVEDLGQAKAVGEKSTLLEASNGTLKHEVIGEVGEGVAEGGDDRFPGQCKDGAVELGSMAQEEGTLTSIAAL